MTHEVIHLGEKEFFTAAEMVTAVKRINSRKLQVKMKSDPRY